MKKLDEEATRRMLREGYEGLIQKQRENGDDPEHIAREERARNLRIEFAVYALQEKNRVDGLTVCEVSALVGAVLGAMINEFTWTYGDNANHSRGHIFEEIEKAHQADHRGETAHADPFTAPLIDVGDA